MNIDDFYDMCDEGQEQYRENPKNFVFNYFCDFSEGTEYWCIGLKDIWEQEGSLDDSGYEPFWVEKLGLSQVTEGTYINVGSASNREITNALLSTGVEYNPDYPNSNS